MNNKQTKIIIAVLAILALAAAALALINKPNALPTSGELVVVVNGETAAVWSAEEIAALPAVELEKKIVDSAGGSVEGVFTGVPLRVLLDNAAPGWAEQASAVVCWGEDAYASSFAISELTQDDSVLLTYLLDGKALGAKAEGGSGPFRIVTARDPFGTRSTRWVCRLEVVR